MRLSQLRELARHLGVPRYSSMLRVQLINGILARVSRWDAAEITESIPLAAPLAELQVPAPPIVEPIPVEERLAATVSQVKSKAFEAIPAAAVSAVESKAFEAIPVAAAPAVESKASVEAPGPAAPSIPSTPAPASLPTPEAGSIEAPTWVSFVPADPQWANISWRISATDRQTALAAGGQQLVIRLTDVTDRLARDARPHTLQEVIVDAAATEWHLPIPLGDRDYRVELGYRTSAGGWYSLVVSSVTRMPADVDLPTPSSVSFSLASTGEGGVNWLFPQPALALHERLYQQASAGRPLQSVGSEEFHGQGALLHGIEGVAGQSSGVGLWASGREGSGAGLTARQRSFWLVADAELIVYGATDPTATVTVADQTMPLSSDGTFKLHMAFPDGEQNYPIRALASDGEQKRSITLDFFRTTPHSQVNRREDAVAEWF